MLRDLYRTVKFCMMLDSFTIAVFYTRGPVTKKMTADQHSVASLYD